MNLIKIKLAWAFALQVCFAAVAMASQVADPVLYPSAGSTAQTVTVTVLDSTPGATIYYTTDGSIPTTASATVASGAAVVINLNQVIKVKAYQGDATPSNAVSGRYAAQTIVSAGPSHVLVVKNDNTAWAWGANSFGQLGNNTCTNAPIPVRITVPGVLPITAVTSAEISFENGMPTWWLKDYFGSTGIDPFDDADGDGVSNLDEYRIGTNPMQSLDLNNNGLPDDWETFYFDDPSHTASAIEDGGTLTNKEQADLGLDPTINEQGMASLRRNYTYDSVGRLIGVSGVCSINYSPDAEGNITNSH